MWYYDELYNISRSLNLTNTFTETIINIEKFETIINFKFNESILDLQNYNKTINDSIITNPTKNQLKNFLSYKFLTIKEKKKTFFSPTNEECWLNDLILPSKIETKINNFFYFDKNNGISFSEDLNDEFFSLIDSLNNQTSFGTAFNWKNQKLYSGRWSKQNFENNFHNIELIINNSSNIDLIDYRNIKFGGNLIFKFKNDNEIYFNYIDGFNNLNIISFNQKVLTTNLDLFDKNINLLKENCNFFF
jgi:hypothetical protein